MHRLSIVAGTLAMAVTAAALAWKFGVSGIRDETGVPVVVTVDCNLPVRVTVRHHPLERREKDKQTELLGESPDLIRLSGAHVGDRIVLENPVQGAYYEQEIPYGEPGQRVQIQKRFDTGHVQFRIGHGAAQGLAVYRNELQIAPYAADVKIALVEGPHTLEIRGPGLKHPARVAVEVFPGQVTYVDPPRIVLDRPSP